MVYIPIKMIDGFKLVATSLKPSHQVLGKLGFSKSSISSGTKFQQEIDADSEADLLPLSESNQVIKWILSCVKAVPSPWAIFSNFKVQSTTSFDFFSLPEILMANLS
ncbi:hypothetical protein HZ326_10327 [Fusarium oxysporum f. sp. albedinis]|nr:hypothetical protein HZ326_10327 [Fusarium oxysporum f. sp. albedinis]